MIELVQSDKSGVHGLKQLYDNETIYDLSYTMVYFVCQP